jgi:hypothetical protein
MNIRFFDRWSLKTRVILFTLATFLVGLWSLAFYANQMLREDLQHMLGEQQFATASFIASEIDDDLSDRLRALETISKNITPSLMAKPGALQAYLELHQVFKSLFNGGIFVTGLDGTALVDIPLSAGRIGINYMDRTNNAHP